MGLFDGLIGNATEADVKTVEKTLKLIVAEGESIEKAFELSKDLIVFSNKRLLFINKQGVTGKKVEYLSIPYRSITLFSIQTAGTFDLEAELLIWIAGNENPIAKQFRKDDSIFDVQRALATYIL
ncbi:PH domain-containing protein [Bacillus sp. FJAT-42315]|uniref:PH domain-containing protein n=1 Tax=Bacillus sp. FJAT-42315 TaxID=2014077 RepID=UPI000BA963F9|nr:PH domain-containing protein [Bacillus sp. FJAT-42315]PAQ15535.1 cytoplasmic protein [Bacillaceae bacterium SAOS 7]